MYWRRPGGTFLADAFAVRRFLPRFLATLRRPTIAMLAININDTQGDLRTDLPPLTQSTLRGYSEPVVRTISTFENAHYLYRGELEFDLEGLSLSSSMLLAILRPSWAQFPCDPSSSEKLQDCICNFAAFQRPHITDPHLILLIIT